MWRAFERAIEAIRKVKSSDIGAGQRATLTSGLLLARLRYFWGTPVFPSEPDSLSAARLQRELDIIEMRLWLDPDQPDLLLARETCWHLMWERFNTQAETLFSKAMTADEYITAVALAEQPIMPDTPRVDYQAIKTKLPLLDYVMRWGQVRQTGSTYRAHCPIHDDQRPSMVIYPNDGVGGKWWCYVCNQGGDVIDYERARLRNDLAVPA